MIALRTTFTSIAPVALLLMATVAGAQTPTRPVTPPYRDRRLPVERRVDDLLGRMTLEEKVAQMLSLWQGKAQITDSSGRFDPARAPRWFRVGIGRIER